jgi:glycosyltransferase involved in cell wall biosynthesis
MQILFIATSRIPTERAMGTAIMKQCEAFTKEGINVTLVVPNRKSKIQENPFSFHGVEKLFEIKRLWCIEILHFGRLGYFLRQITFLFSLFLFQRKYPRSVILYSREPEILGFVPTRKKKVAELHHLYGLKTFGSFILNQISHFITITHALKDDIIHRYGIPERAVHVAPSGVSLAEYVHTETKSEARKRLGLPEDTLAAFYIGEFDIWKGISVFLESSSALHTWGITPVVIGGSSDEVASYEKQYPQVRFLGRRPQSELPHNQQAADVLVIPNSGKYPISARHTSPLKVFAGMTSGVPIVASDITSIREILSNEAAFFVPPDDPKALSDMIHTVLLDGEGAVRRATCARLLVLQYDWSTRAKGIISFLKDV